MKKPSLILLFSVFVFYSCDKELKSIQLDKDKITMHYNETTQLNVSCSPSDVEVPITLDWSSENEGIASVDEQGLVAGVKIGETNVIVQTKDKKFESVCKVTIEPISALYKEPIIEFGKNKSYIKEKETRKISVEDSNSIIYEGENSDIEYILYNFESDRLISSSVRLVAKTSVKDEAEIYINERYYFVDKTHESSIYRVNSSVIADFMYEEDLYLVILYMENMN